MIKITYKGKMYTNLETAFDDAIYDTLIKGIKQKLKPFEKEIQESGGTVTIEALPNYKVNLSVENISDDLKDRIMSAMAK